MKRPKSNGKFVIFVQKLALGGIILKVTTISAILRIIREVIVFIRHINKHQKKLVKFINKNKK